MLLRQWRTPSLSDSGWPLGSCRNCELGREMCATPQVRRVHERVPLHPLDEPSHEVGQIKSERACYTQLRRVS